MFVFSLPIHFNKHSPISRGTLPNAFDRQLSTRFGINVVEFLTRGQTNVMTGLNGREILPIPIETVISQPK